MRLKETAYIMYRMAKPDHSITIILIYVFDEYFFILKINIKLTKKFSNLFIFL